MDGTVNIMLSINSSYGKFVINTCVPYRHIKQETTNAAVELFQLRQFLYFYIHTTQQKKRLTDRRNETNQK